jgi:hexulose-6-phosphate isomerase
VDFAAVFRKLEELRFRGPYVIEMWHRDGQDPNREIESALSFIRDRYAEGTRR